MKTDDTKIKKEFEEKTEDLEEGAVDNETLRLALGGNFIEPLPNAKPYGGGLKDYKKKIK